MTSSSYHSLNQYQVQENHVGSPVGSYQQQMYNRYGYLQPGIWVWPQQQFGDQQNYEDQYRTYQHAYGNYYYHAPWSFNQQQNEYNELQTRYDVESFRDHSIVDSTNGQGISNGFDSNFPDKLFGESSYSVNNGNQRSCQSEQHNPGQVIIGMNTPLYAWS